MKWNWFNKKPDIEPEPVMEWIESRYELPAPNSDKKYLICHYNGFMEVARRKEGCWWAISSRISEPDEKLSKEGQPDYWLEIFEPDFK